MTLDLPGGRRGQILAIALTLTTLAALIIGAVLPVIGLYDERAAAIADQRLRVEHMSRIASELPQLHREAEQAAAQPPPPVPLIEGDSDAVAAARLQETVQSLAADAGCTISSLETLPGEPVAWDRPGPPGGQDGPRQPGGLDGPGQPGGNYRKISLHVALSAPYSALIELLRALDEAQPRLFVDDLRLQGPLVSAGQAAAPMDASLTVIAFRASGDRTP